MENTDQTQNADGNKVAAEAAAQLAQGEAPTAPHEPGQSATDERPEETTGGEKVTLSMDPLDGVPASGWNPARETIFLLNDTEQATRRQVGQLPNIDATNPNDSEQVLLALEHGPVAHPRANVHMRSLDREDSEWNQFVETENGKLGPSRPGFKDPGRKLTGEKGMMHVRALLGFGTLVKVPLWHSGFWITFKAPNDAALLELERRIADEKVTLGRRTHGLLFANNSVFFQNWLIDFALAHVYDTTLKEEDDVDLKKKIRILDIPLLIWGIACTIWPNGFQYSRAIVNGESQEIKYRQGLLNLGKLLFTDQRSLTKTQKRHMANERNKDMTAQSLEEYRKEFNSTNNAPSMTKRVKLSDLVEVELEIPTIDALLESGTTWVNNIVTMVDQAFSLPPTDNKRDRFIAEHGSATYLRQYAHLIKAIHFNDGSENGRIVDERDDIDETLDIMSSSMEIGKEFFKKCIEYIEDSTIALLGVPVETDDDKKKSLPRLQSVLPLDVASVFFILLRQKTALIRAR